MKTKSKGSRCIYAVPSTPYNHIMLKRIRRSRIKEKNYFTGLRAIRKRNEENNSRYQLKCCTVVVVKDANQQICEEGLRVSERKWKERRDMFNCWFRSYLRLLCFLFRLLHQSVYSQTYGQMRTQIYSTRIHKHMHACVRTARTHTHTDQQDESCVRRTYVCDANSHIHTRLSATSVRGEL